MWFIVSSTRVMSAPAFSRSEPARAEMSTAFTQSALYTLLDGRLRAGKKTIVSTNLDRDALAERYGAALASRLGGEYEWLEFLGRDIRAQRKELR